MCKHIARRMPPSLKLCSDHVLLLPDSSSRTMEDLLRRAAHELDRNGRSGEEREETRDALVAAGVGRGDRGGRNAGDRGYGERDRGRGQPHTYCAHHGEGQGHNTPECIVMRREFDRHYGDFCEYLQTRGLGPYAAGRGGGRGAEGQYRQQPYLNDSGARWSRGHPPEQQRARQPPGHGPGLGGYADRFGQVPPFNLPPYLPPNLPPGQFSNVQRHAFAANYPYYDNGYRGYSGWGQQRSTGQHHRRTRLVMDSRLPRGALARALTATLEGGTP